MRLLLDSHVLLWLMRRDARLDPGALETIVGGKHEVFVSAATIWEVEIKRLTGKLDAPHDLLARTEEAGFELLDVTPDQVVEAARLPLHHRDPFDRLLVAQAQAEAATLVTHDGALAAYAVPIMRVDE